MGENENEKNGWYLSSQLFLFYEVSFTASFFLFYRLSIDSDTVEIKALSCLEIDSWCPSRSHQLSECSIGNILLMHNLSSLIE